MEEREKESMNWDSGTVLQTWSAPRRDLGSILALSGEGGPEAQF